MNQSRQKESKSAKFLRRLAQPKRLTAIEEPACASVRGLAAEHDATVDPSLALASRREMAAGQ
jgi:hypothetical protein